jgi:hypothetical protein
MAIETKHWNQRPGGGGGGGGGGGTDKKWHFPIYCSNQIYPYTSAWEVVFI